jgi:hypothetical protein
MQQWRVRIKGKHRQEVDIALLMQAVIALGKQLQTEARTTSDQTVLETRRREEDV